jgi:hypothetical protein
MVNELAMKVVGFRIRYYAALGFGGLAAILILISLHQYNDYAALSLTVTLFIFILNENSILRSYLGKQGWLEWHQFQVQERPAKNTA